MNAIFSNKIISIDELWRFFNLSSSLFCIVAKDGYFKHINPGFNLLGFGEEELISRPYEDFIHPDDRALTNQKLNELKTGKPVTFFQTRQLMSHGNYKWFSWTAFLPTTDGDIYAIGQDSTEKVILQEQLIEQRILEERSVMQAIIHGKETERNEIGKELHDNVCQMLTTVKLYHDMAVIDKKSKNELIKTATEILLSAIDEIRTLSRSLVTHNITELSLSESVRDLIETIMKGKKIKIAFQYNPDNEKLPGKLKLTLFRMIQEQLNNILKHANAKNVNIQISDDAGNIKLTIQDDGQGFDTCKKKNGIGLKNIISRAELYNGAVKIDSAPGEGCLMTVIIPSNEFFKIAV
jgi:PAS domain S-box-containing protein